MQVLTSLRRLIAAATALLFVATPVQASTLRIGVIGELGGAQPDLRTSGAAAMIGGLALRGLTYFDGRVEMECLLCETLPTVANGGVVDAPTPSGEPGQKVRFRLKPGLRWDDGRPVTARDVVLAWNVGRAPDSAYSWRSRLADEIVAVRALNDRLVEVQRRGRACIPSDFRFAALPSHLETAAARGAVAGYAEKSLHVRAPTTRGLYNGPYRVSDYVDAPTGRQKVVLDRNPHWSGRRLAYDRIELIYRPTGAAMTAALVAGEVDLLLNTSLEVADEVARRAPGKFAEVRRPGRFLMQVALNHDDPRLADVRVRRALLLALDREALAASFGPQTVAARSFLTERFPYFEAAADGGGDAARLLHEAGWKPGSDGVRRNDRGQALSFRLAVAPAHADKPFVRQLIDGWRRIGVAVETGRFGGIAQLTARDPPPLALFPYQLEGGRNVDFHVFGSHSIPAEGEVRNGLNIFRYRHPETDRLVAQLRDGCAPEELAGAYRALQRRVAEDLPLLPLFFLPEAHLLPPDLEPPAADRIAFMLPQEVETWRRRRSSDDVSPR
jgi:peptide/nickel transport system substrate-binding protein